jgi:putrescine aminotransferase
MVRGIRDSLVFCPPLIVTHAEIDCLVDTMKAALDEAAPILRALPAVV